MANSYIWPILAFVAGGVIGAFSGHAYASKQLGAEMASLIASNDKLIEDVNEAYGNVKKELKAKLNENTVDYNPEPPIFQRLKSHQIRK